MKAIVAGIGAVILVLLFVFGFWIALQVEQAQRNQQQQPQKEISSNYTELPEDTAALHGSTAIDCKDKLWLAFKVLCSEFGIFLLDILEHLNGNSNWKEWSWSIFWTLNYSFLSGFLWFYSLWRREAQYSTMKHLGTTTLMMGFWSFNLAGTAGYGMILWGISSDTDETTMLYSSSSDTAAVLLKEEKWEFYEFFSTVALFITVFCAVRNWFRSDEDKVCTALAMDDDDNNNKENSCFATEPARRKSVVFKEEMNECFRIGGSRSRSGDLSSIYTDEEAG